MTDSWVRVFDVLQPLRPYGKNYTVYKVVSRVFPKNCLESVTEIIVWKRFSQFRKLYKALLDLHQGFHLKGNFPSFPEAKLFGRFDSQVIEERRQAALSLLQFTSKYPPLFTSNVFVKFFEEPDAVMPPNLPQAASEEDMILPNPLEPERVALPPSESEASLRSESSEEGNGWSSSLRSVDGDANDSVGKEKGEEKSRDIEDKGDEVASLFDPLRGKPLDSETNEKANKRSSWLLFAISSSSNGSIASRGEDSVDGNPSLAFPKPFIDFPEESSQSISAFEENPSGTECPSQGESDEVTIRDETIVAQETKKEENEGGAERNGGEETSKIVPTETYLVDAATLIGQAQLHEENCEFEPAFESYKCAVGILLQGVKSEKDSTRREAVRRKTLQYLSRAEHIYEVCFNDSERSARKWAPDSPFKAARSLSLSDSLFNLRGSTEELRTFKVRGIVGKVQLVTDFVTNKSFVIKVLYKSAAGKSLPKQLPQSIPNLVKLYKVFETEYALFLLLQHAEGGKLWDHLYSTLSTRNTLSPCADCTFASVLPSGDPFASSGACVEGVPPDHLQEDCDTFESKFDSFEQRSALSSFSGSVTSLDSLENENTSNSYSNLCTKYALSRERFKPSNFVNCKVDSNSFEDMNEVDNTVFVARCDNPNRANDGNNGNDATGTSKKNHKRQLSSEGLGISQLLEKAKVLLKNVDETLRSTKHVVQNSYSRKMLPLRASKSDVSLSQRPRLVSEVFHQMECYHQTISNSPLASECQIKRWLSQIITTLHGLHKMGIFYCDLKPDNLLVGDSLDDLLVCYKCESGQEGTLDDFSRTNLYSAPEVVSGCGRVSHLSDWWSVGVLGYELLTSRSLVSYFPNGINNHTLIYFPEYLSLEAKDLLVKLLQPNPLERIGRHGPEEISMHPFFAGIEWEQL